MLPFPPRGRLGDPAGVCLPKAAGVSRPRLVRVRDFVSSLVMLAR